MYHGTASTLLPLILRNSLRYVAGESPPCRTHSESNKICVCAKTHRMAGGVRTSQWRSAIEALPSTVQPT